MSHPKNKRERILYHNKKRDYLKNISKMTGPYLPYPVYADESLRNRKYSWRDCALRDYHDYRNMTGKYADEPYYIRQSSRYLAERFFKRAARKAVRKRSDETFNYGQFKKVYPLWYILY